MKYCKHLKKRKNKPYCNITRKEITLSQCRECDKKEYRFPVKGKTENRKNVKINNKKSTIFVKNRSFLRNNAQNNQKTVQTSLQNSANNCRKMKNKSKKLARLERKRKSVFTDDLEHCYLCGNKKDDLHELLGGRNRLNCIRLGYIIPVCRLCHSRIQDDYEFKMYWAKKVQLHYEEGIGARDDFIAIFRRNYLE